MLKEDPQRYENVNDLWTLIAFILGSHQCRWQYLCEYFDEDHVVGNRCTICDICSNRQNLVEFNITLLLELMGKSLIELNEIDINVLKEFALGRKGIGKNSDLLHHQYFGFLRYFDNIFLNKIMATYVRRGMSNVIFRNTQDLVSLTLEGRRITENNRFDEVILVILFHMNNVHEKFYSILKFLTFIDNGERDKTRPRIGHCPTHL